MGPTIRCCLYGLNPQQVCVAAGMILGLLRMGAGSQQNIAIETLNDGAFWRKKVEEVPVNQVRGVCPILMFHPISLSSH